MCHMRQSRFLSLSLFGEALFLISPFATSKKYVTLKTQAARHTNKRKKTERLFKMVLIVTTALVCWSRFCLWVYRFAFKLDFILDCCQAHLNVSYLGEHRKKMFSTAIVPSLREIISNLLPDLFSV